MTAVVIEAGIPLKTRGRRPSAELEAMRRMSVGDSFLMDDYIAANRVRFHQCKIPGRKFCLRKVPGGWRTWRVA
jgi:hypothetical protein